MKKTIAGILAFLCVLNPLSGNWQLLGVEKSSIIMEASAAEIVVPEEGKYANDYSYKYADTTIYSTIAKLDSRFGTWRIKDAKKDITCGIYKITVNKDKKEVYSEYVVGIQKADENVIDVFGLSEDLVPSDVMNKLVDYNIELNGNNIRYIAPKAFANSYLKTIDLEGVEYIDNYAFQSCKYLSYVEIPQTVKYTGKGLFSKSGIKNISILNEMPVIPEEFCENTPITNLSFAHPELIRTIGASAFANSSIPAPIFMTCYEEDISEYENLSVGENAYKNCTSIKRVALTDNVVSLGASSFSECTSLTDVIFNDVLHTIGTGCFSKCTSIKEISGIPETVDDSGFGNAVFSNCTSLIRCTLPESLTKIKDQTFSGCTSLITVDFNAGSEGINILTIGNAAFSKCTSLPSASFKNVVVIEPSAYSGCTKLASADFPAAVFIGGTEAANRGEIKDTELDLEKSLITGSAKGSAFSGCSSLERVNIPSSKYIFPSSFYNCKALTEFNAGICEIVGNKALDSCSSLTDITLLSRQYGNAAPTKSNTSDGYIFQNCSSAKKITIDAKFLVNYPYKTPNGFFNGCQKLEEIATENGDFEKVAIISSKTFSGCESLKEMGFVDKEIRIIESDAFANCKSLTSISANDSITLNAEDYLANAFLNCSKLIFQVEGNISTIGNNAFKNSGITSVNIEGMKDGTVVVGNSAFADCANLTSATIKSGSAAKFSIGDSIFANCPKLKEATYEGTIVTASMFKNCPLLEKVTTNAKNIKASAFDGDTKLALVADMNDTSKSIIADEINEYAFRDCNALTVFPANEETVLKGKSIFSNCTSLTNAEVGILTEGIFSGCTKLSDVKFKIDLDKKQNEGIEEPIIKEIPKSAFAKCESLNSIDIENMSNIWANAFDGAGLTSVKLNKADTVDTSAFANCSELNSIDINASKINTKAFYNCKSLTDAVLNVNTIGNNAFDGCNSLNNVKLNGLTSLGSNAFANCSSLNQLTIKGNPNMGSKCVGFVNNKLNPKFTLLCDTDSTVETYAKANNISFYEADSYDPITTATATTTTTTTTKTTTTVTQTTSKSSSNITPGDANCDKQVDLSDAVLIMQSLANPDKYGVKGTDSKHISAQGLENADVFERGTGVTTSDALEIQKYLLNIVKNLS